MPRMTAKRLDCALARVCGGTQFRRFNRFDIEGGSAWTIAFLTL
jgi:hypothetical protein